MSLPYPVLKQQQGPGQPRRPFLACITAAALEVSSTICLSVVPCRPCHPSAQGKVGLAFFQPPDLSLPSCKPYEPRPRDWLLL